MMFDTFWSDVLATLAGGVVLALMFFYIKERLFAIPELFGRWYFELHTEHTVYNPYRGMTLKYIVMLWREGNRVAGTVEKYHEISSEGEREYIGKDRVSGIVNGYIEKRYFAKDVAHLHVQEKGAERESSYFMNLTLTSPDIMDGVFSSMVAEQDGSAHWSRKKL